MTRKLLQRVEFPDTFSIKNYTLEGLSPLGKDAREDPKSSDIRSTPSIGGSAAGGAGRAGAAAEGSAMEKPTPTPTPTPKLEENDKDDVDALCLDPSAAAPPQVVEDDGYVYDLRGVIVHSGGTAEGGTLLLLPEAGRGAVASI